MYSYECCEHCARAWAAGFFDGEGGTGLDNHGERSSRYPTIRVVVTQAELSTLERFRQSVDGIGTILGPITKNREGRKPLYRYRAYDRNAAEVLQKLWPWLSEPKREQARQAIAVYNQNLVDRPRRKYRGVTREPIYFD